MSSRIQTHNLLPFYLGVLGLNLESSMCFRWQWAQRYTVKLFQRCTELEAFCYKGKKQSFGFFFKLTHISAKITYSMRPGFQVDCQYVSYKTDSTVNIFTNLQKEGWIFWWIFSVAFCFNTILVKVYFLKMRGGRCTMYIQWGGYNPSPFTNSPDPKPGRTGLLH